MRMLNFVFAALVVAALSILAAPAPAHATTAAGSCDSIWLAYNNCLVSSDGYFEKKLCDLDFLIAMTACRRLEP